jgi:HPt (histidine-containing phosphotransfer) domain-containing protein
MAFESFDAEDVLNEFGDEAVVAELATIVRADLETYIAELTTAIATADLKRVRELAHTLKGAVGNVSAKPAQELAGRIDQGLRAGDTAVTGLVPDLLVQCHKLRAELGLWLTTLRPAGQTH